MKNNILLPAVLCCIFKITASAQVIYEVYPSGGATGATWNVDAVILQGPANFSLNGKSLQYQSATGTGAWGSIHNFAASDAFNSSGFFYCQVGTVGTSGAPLPFTPNAVITAFSMSNNGGKVALVNGTGALSGCPSMPSAGIYDFFGYTGTATANCAEGTPFAWNGSVTNSMKRTQDTNNNSVDFVINLVPLPIELKDFNVSLQQNKVVLNWITASEHNNHQFVVERSGNGVAFVPIGTVIGEGTAERGNSYFYTDDQPLRGIGYYRLQQVDFDGSTTYSPVRVVQNGSGATIGVFPNPVNTGGVLTVQLHSFNEGAIQLTVFDQLGRSVLQQQLELTDGENQLMLPVMDLLPGMYELEMKNENTTNTSVFVVK